MRSPKSLRAAARLLAAASAISWAAIIAGVWEPVPERAMDALTAIAPAITVIAVMCWLTSGNRSRDETRGALIDTIVRLTRRASRHTGPLRRVQ